MDVKNKYWIRSTKHHWCKTNMWTLQKTTFSSNYKKQNTTKTHNWYTHKNNNRASFFTRSPPWVVFSKKNWATYRSGRSKLAANNKNRHSIPFQLLTSVCSTSQVIWTTHIICYLQTCGSHKHKHKSDSTRCQKRIGISCRLRAPLAFLSALLRHRDKSLI